MATISLILCPLCEYASSSLKLHISHLRLVHAKDDSFRVVCGINGCVEVFCAFSALNSHIYRQHRIALGFADSADDDFPTTSTSMIDTIDGGTASGMQFQEFDEDSDIAPEPSLPEHPLSNHPKLSAAQFILQLREGRQVSQVAIADIKEGCNKLCSETVKTLQAKIRGQLSTAGINCDSVPGLNDTLSMDVDIFEGINSNYLFEKFCVDRFGCVVSQHCMHVCM